MFKKLLIANRGEIACRVIRTARRLGIRTVAVYSAADAQARHVRLADEAFLIGPAPAGQSYLCIEPIIAAARQAGAEAIHPGYGFLAESAEFAEACTAAGLTFIGPPAAAIRAMGLKSAAKALMAAAGVPLTPGYHGDRQAADFLKEQADEIGYPVLIKASAGGGGKGMRLVERGEDFSAALAACRREAAASFADDRVLLEKYLRPARHIEMQIFADCHGNCIHLFERDCSVQRRHQKVLEEAPAPGMSAEWRQQMGEAAIAAARAVGYVGAGTVEFISSQDGHFYFMEMNTRLQVEHPVTEMITGLDLVEWQLRVAAGQTLPLTQAQLEIQGHALEARIYAEDTGKGFLPATGRLIRLSSPLQSRHVRVDTGVEEGDEITPHYDPMIAKLIVWDEDRDAALARMREALSQYRIAGVNTNVAFLSRLVACPAFTAAELDTGLIERQSDWLFSSPPPLPVAALMIAAMAELLAEQDAARPHAPNSSDPWSPWHAAPPWRMNLPYLRRIRFRDGEQPVEVQARRQNGVWLLCVQGQSAPARGERLGDGRLSIEIDGHRQEAEVVSLGNERHVFLDGAHHVLRREQAETPSQSALPAVNTVTAPMPGKVAALLAQPGQSVEKGTPLLILEAMKMEHTLTAPGRGTVKAFRFAPGDQVPDGASLVDFEPDQ